MCFVHPDVIDYDLTTPTTVSTRTWPAVANDAMTGVTFGAIADAIEGPETLVLCIIANAAYTIGETSCATFYLTGTVSHKRTVQTFGVVTTHS